MSARFTAQFYSPSKIYMIDMDENRLKMAEKFGNRYDKLSQRRRAEKE
jgi:threonine dehydrogenase-like Zn-dependent dehydrogenase